MARIVNYDIMKTSEKFFSGVFFVMAYLVDFYLIIRFYEGHR
jgi:hypothetical protein